MNLSSLEAPYAGPRMQAAGKKLLLVDDNLEELVYYSAIFQHLGYEVRPCASFTYAANSFARQDFDLVAVSHGGTAFEGRAVLARALEADGNIPVLVLARHADMDCYAEALQMGAVDPIDRALTPSEVAELVAKYIRPDSPPRRTTFGAGPAWISAR